MNRDATDETADQKSEGPRYFVDLVMDLSDYMNSETLNRQFYEALGKAKPEDQECQ